MSNLSVLMLFIIFATFACLCPGCARDVKLMVVDGTSGKPLAGVAGEEFGHDSNYFGHRQVITLLKETGPDGILFVGAAIDPLLNNDILLSRSGFASAIASARGGTTDKIGVVSPAVNVGSFGPGGSVIGTDLGWHSAEAGYFRVPLFPQPPTTRGE